MERKMGVRYQIKGSNIFFKVWGIILLVLTAIRGILALIFTILLFTIPAMLRSSVAEVVGSSYSSYIMDSVTGSVMVFAIIAFLFSAAILTVETMAGILLVRDYVKSKEILVVYAVLYFAAGFLNAICFIFLIAINVNIWLIFLVLLILSWQIATGVILIVKQGRAVRIPSYSPGIASAPRPGSIPSAPTGMVEGQFGAYQGRRSELYTGKLYKIGRESSCEIQVNHPKVSRIHCTVCKLPNGRYQITDCSSNGTFYDNIKLQKGGTMEVKPGGLLVLGEADNVLQLK